MKGLELPNHEKYKTMFFFLIASLFQGSYLAACSHFSAIWDEPCTGNTFTFGLEQASSQPDRPFHKLRASKSRDRRALGCSEMKIDGFWSFKSAKGSVGKMICYYLYWPLFILFFSAGSCGSASKRGWRDEKFPTVEFRSRWFLRGVHLWLQQQTINATS